MRVVPARHKRSFFPGRRYPRKRLATVLWVSLALLILCTAIVKLRGFLIAKPYDDDFDAHSKDKQLRVARLKELQAQEERPPPIVKLTLFDVCPTICGRTTASDIFTGMPLVDVKHIDIDATSISLDEPPIPIIGTDKDHRRLVSGWDVAEFMAHVRMWRYVFHGDGGIGIMLSCRVKDPLPVLTALRKDSWFRNKTEGGTMGKDNWDILLLGAGLEASVPAGRVQSRVVSQNVIARNELLGYALSQRGANRLLSFVRAYTVPMREFLAVVLDKDVKILRWDGAGLGRIEECETETGEVRDSTLLPFYPPVHWIHAAAKNKK